MVLPLPLPPPLLLPSRPNIGELSSTEPITDWPNSDSDDDWPPPGYSSDGDDSGAAAAP